MNDLLEDITVGGNSIRYWALPPRIKWDEIKKQLDVVVPLNLVYELDVNEADPTVYGYRMDARLFVGTELDTSKFYLNSKSFKGETSQLLGESLSNWINSELLCVEEYFIE